MLATIDNISAKEPIATTLNCDPNIVKWNSKLQYHGGYNGEH